MNSEQRKEISMKKSSKILSLIACTSLLAGCSAQTPKTEEPDSKTDKEPIQASAGELKSLNSFSWKFFANEHEEKSNLTVSPLSAFYALGMAATGAQGETLKQIESALGLNVSDANSLASSLMKTEESQKQMRIANSAWINQVLADDINADFSKVLSEDYQAQMKSVPFDESTVKEVNDWVSDKTGHMIDKMVNSFDDPALVLINALAFDGKWEDPYTEDDISEVAFRNADGTESNVNLMFSDEGQYAETSHLEGFTKPYEGGDYAFAAFLPKDNKTLDEAISASGDKLGDEIYSALESTSSVTVHAGIPEFDSSSELSLKENLKSMGILDAFDDKADFSGMTDSKAPLYISEILQKTKIEVNAAGTKAGASTSTMIDTMAAPAEEEKTIICDQPFLYVVYNTETCVPVFIGVMEQAGQSSES